MALFMSEGMLVQFLVSLIIINENFIDKFLFNYFIGQCNLNLTFLISIILLNDLVAFRINFQMEIFLNTVVYLMPWQFIR